MGCSIKNCHMYLGDGDGDGDGDGSFEDNIIKFGKGSEENWGIDL